MLTAFGIADPVFLASQCGESSRAPPSATALSTDDAYDYRLWSLDAAVEFAKMNNLLGVLLDAGLLVSGGFVVCLGLPACVPSDGRLCSRLARFADGGPLHRRGCPR